METCNTCKKLWTSDCPIRVWGRTEKNDGKNLDVDRGKDYCSRYTAQVAPLTESYPNELRPCGGSTKPIRMER